MFPPSSGYIGVSCRILLIKDKHIFNACVGSAACGAAAVCPDALWFGPAWTEGGKEGLHEKSREEKVCTLKSARLLGHDGSRLAAREGVQARVGNDEMT